MGFYQELLSPVGNMKKSSRKVSAYVNDPLGDMITRIRNKHIVKASTVKVPSSKLRVRFLDVMKNEGYIRDYEQVEEGKFKKIVVHLKYFQDSPVIRNIKRVSVPGRRVYVRSCDFKKVCNGLGISIVSTSSGLMTDVEARKKGLGGEVLCEVL